MLTSQILLARLLMPADFGIIAMVAPILGFVIIMADLGIVQAIVQRPILTRGQLNSFFWFNNALSAIMALILMAFSGALARFYHEPRLASVTVALASLVMVTGLSMQQSALLNRTMRFSALAIAETASQALGLCASAFSAWRGLGYWSLVIGQATVSIINGLVVWTASAWRPTWPSFSTDAFEMLKFGGSVTISNIALYLNSVLDNVIVGFYLGEVSLGLYDRAWKLAVMPLSQLMAPITRVAVPALTRLTTEQDRYRNAFTKMVRVLMIVALPGLSIAVIVSQPLVTTLFGARWREVAPVFSWLCAGSMLTPVNTVTFWLLISQGRARDQVIYGSAAAVINIMAYWIGVHWGLVGVPITSTVIAYLVPTPLLIWAATRLGPVGLGLFVETIYPFVFSTLAAMSGLELFMRYFGVTNILDLFAVSVLSYAVSIVVLMCFGSGRAAAKDAFEMATVFISKKRKSVEN
jgi:PST family polysaccharide transporter